MSSVVLPQPLGPIRPTLSPRSMVAVKRSISSRSPNAHRHLLQLGDDLARRSAGIELQAHLAEFVAPVRALLAQLDPAAPRAPAARAPRLDALADPDLVLRQQLVGARRGPGFGVRARVLGAARRRRSCPGSCATGRGRARRCAWPRASMKRAVVRHQHQRAAPAIEQLLQPLDGGDVQVVGRLVEQQHVGCGDQRLRQRDALLRAARQLVDAGIGVQVQPLQGLRHALLPGPAVERLEPCLQRVEVVTRAVRLVTHAQRARLGDAFGDGVEHGGAGLERGLLRDVDRRTPVCGCSRPSSGFEAAEDLQQRRLAGAVAADQRDPLTVRARSRRQRATARGRRRDGRRSA